MLKLLSLELYKPNQGRIVRRATLAALVGLMFFGASSLNTQLTLLLDATYRRLVVLVAFGFSVWLAYRIVNYERFAEFLISTESEAERIQWPARLQVIRSTVIVMVSIVALAFLLLFMDLVWKQFFSLLGFLRIDI